METRLSTRQPTFPRLLPAFAWLVVFYNVLVILWGALVRATGSGAGCGNHWPLCNGQVIPVSPNTHTVIEFTHRMMTGGSTFLVVALLIWILRTCVRGQAARGFAIASTVLLLNEALLGALLVKLGYVGDNQSTGRMVVLSIHLSNTLLLIAALTLTARMLATRQKWPQLRRTRHFAVALTGLIATILVGITGSLAALGDTLFPSPTLSAAFAQDLTAHSPLLLRLRIVHPLSAVVAAAFLIYLSAMARRSSAPEPSAPRTAALLLGLLAAQFALGILDVLLLAPAWLQILHLFGADLLWVTLVLLSAQMVWPTSALMREPASPAQTPHMAKT